MNLGLVLLAIFVGSSLTAFVFFYLLMNDRPKVVSIDKFFRYLKKVPGRLVIENGRMLVRIPDVMDMHPINAVYFNRTGNSFPNCDYRLAAEALNMNPWDRCAIDMASNNEVCSPESSQLQQRLIATVKPA